MLKLLVLSTLSGSFGDGRRFHPKQAKIEPSGVAVVAHTLRTQNLLRASTLSSLCGGNRFSHANTIISGRGATILQQTTNEVRIGSNLLMRDHEVMPKPGERGYKRARFKQFLYDLVLWNIQDREVSPKPGERGYKRARFKSFLHNVLPQKMVSQSKRFPIHVARNDTLEEEVRHQALGLDAAGALADNLAVESLASAVKPPKRVHSVPDNVLNQSRLRSAEEMRKALRDDVYQHFGVQLSEYEESWLTEEILGIYVRAKQTPQERLELLVKALEWRIANREMLQSQTCSYCLRNPLSHDARLFGFDKVGDFLFMNCFELPRDISVDSVTEHIACMLELALKQYPLSTSTPLDDDGHPKVRQWTFIFDLHGFGLRYYDPRVTVSLLQLFQVVHRGRVKRLIVMDAPKIFWGFWKLVKPFLRKSTVKKLAFSDWTNIRPELEANFGNSLTAELLEEAAENRDPEKAASKTWTTFYGPSLSQARLGSDIDMKIGGREKT